MPTIAELAKITVTPATWDDLRRMVDLLTDRFRQLAEAMVEAGERITEAFRSWVVTVGDSYSTAPPRRSYPGSDPVFRRRGRGR